MNEATFTESLQGVLYDGLDVEEAFDGTGVERVSTFEESGVMTMNKGLVVALEDGSEFQLTIVQLRPGRRDDEEDDA